MIAAAVNTWRRWGSKAGFSIADQGIVSGANFALNVLLARWLTPGQYGAFAIAFSIFLFISGFHNALLLEPMSVIGPAKYKEQLPKYLGNLVWIHGGLALSLGLILAGSTGILAITGFSMRGSLLGLSFAVPFILFFWLLRRACYVATRPELASKGSLSYALFIILGLFMLRGQGWLSPFSAFILMAGASMGASLVLWGYLEITVRRISWAEANPGFSVVIRDHWRYGRWVLGSAMVHWLSSIIYLPLIGLFAGLAEAGAFRAMQNLVLPLQQTLTALGLLLLPWFSAQRTNYQGEGYLKEKLRKIISLSICFSGGYVIFLILFGRPIVDFLYGGSYYDDFLWLLPYVGAVAILGATRQGLGIVLKALERPDVVFWSQTSGALLTVSIGLYLVWAWKLRGAALGTVLCAFLMALVLIYFLLSRWREA